VRYIALDAEHKVSFNSSSLLTNVFASDESMAHVLLSDATYGNHTYPSDVLAGLYDKRTVQFNNITGKVQLTAEATHYLLDFTGGGKSEGIWGFGGKERASSVMRGDY